MRSTSGDGRHPFPVRALGPLLLAYPRRFRRTYGAEVLDTFVVRYRNTAWRRRPALWIRTAGDLLANGVRERDRERRLSLAPLAGPPPSRQPNHRPAEMLMHSIVSDVRFAIRTLIKRPGFAAVAVATLALGIGANTAVFSLVHKVVLRALPFEQPDELVRIWSRNPGEGRERYFTSPLSFFEWQARAERFESMAAVWRTEATLTDDEGTAVRLKAMYTTVDWFDVLGVAPEIGRTFGAEDAVWNNPIIILSYGFWQSRFGGNPDVVGRAVRIDGKPSTILGVIPRGRALLEEADIWVGFEPPRQQPANYMDVIARLRPGMTVDVARADLVRVAAGLQEEFPRALRNWTIDLAPLHEVVVGDVRPALLIIFGTTGLVLLIACANVANLLLARTEARFREIALRTALGAGRGRLVRQLLTESFVLATAGGVVGLGVAYGGLRTLTALVPATLPRFEGVTIDGMLLLAALTASVVTGVLFGLAPALQFARADIQPDLKAGGSRSVGPGHARLRNGFVVAQLALAVTVAIGAGLLVKSFANLRSTDPGFNPEGVLTFELNLTSGDYPSLQNVADTYDRLLQSVAALPGVRSAGMTSSLPLAEPLDYLLEVIVIGKPSLPSGENPAAWYRQVSAGFFETMGIPIIRGRAFGDADRADAPAVVIINRAAARVLFDSEEDPVGRRVRSIAGGFGPLGRILNGESEIVGVVDDVRYGNLRTATAPSLYFPAPQAPFRRMTVALRTVGDPAGLTQPVRRQIAMLDANLPIGKVATMQDALERSLSRDRFSMVLIGVFGIVALALAAIGIYGVLSYMVVQRTRELGIRMALGATRADVVTYVMGQSATLIAVGLGVGVVTSLFATRAMAAQLYGVRATDPLTFLAVAVLLAAVALLASYVPAVRATRVDPLTALKYE